MTLLSNLLSGGYAGNPGATGATGFQGASGSTGIQGASGSTGFQGASGSTGFQGASGATGIDGASGSTGLTGATGIQGPTGGASGPQGASGATGIDGASGATGLTGATGVAGLGGATGVAGVVGATGNQQTNYTSLSITSNTLTVDLSSLENTFFNVSLNANINTVNINNTPAGQATIFFLVFTGNGTQYSITWPANVYWEGSIAPTPSNINGKKDNYSFLTVDGGTTWLATVIGQNY